MKIKRVFFILTLVLASITSFGQLNFGIKGGPSFVSIREKDPNAVLIHSKYNWRPSYHFGIFFKYKLSNRSAVVMDFLFSDKGFKYLESTTHFGYLSIPVTFRYSIYKKISFEGGGELGLLRFAYLKDGSSKIDRTDHFGNKTDLGVLGGFVYDFSDRLSLTIRYTHGLSNILNKDDVVYLSPGSSQNYYDMGLKYTNQSLYLSLSYIIKRAK